MMATSAPALVALPPPAPPAPPGWAYRWSPPTYHTLRERVWVPETCTQVLQWVEISPGRWVQTWAPLLQPGYWTLAQRQELVTPGHWELVALPPPLRPRPMPRPRPIEMAPPTGTVGVDGYRRGGAEDLHAFSGLTEWPSGKEQ